MSASSKAVVRRFYDDIFTKGDLAAIDEVVASDCVEHTPPQGVGSSDVRGALKEFTELLRAAIPDVRVEVGEILAEGDLVAAFWMAEGTHEHELMGIPGTGGRVSFAGVDVVRVVDGRCTDHWGFDNILPQLAESRP